MFDAVRIRRTPETEAAGYAGLEGVIYGVTTVSVTAVDVIGRPEEDCAINVDFDSRAETAWFQPSFVEVIGQPETTISIGARTFQRGEGADDWVDVTPTPWWKFWYRR